MTKQEFLKAVEMRYDGYTLQEIADEFGCSKQCIEEKFRLFLKKQSHKERHLANSKYPNLTFEIFAICKNEKDFCEKAGIDYRKYLYMIRDERKPTFDEIMKCCEYLNKDCRYLFTRKGDE